LAHATASEAILDVVAIDGKAGFSGIIARRGERAMTDTVCKRSGFFWGGLGLLGLSVEQFHLWKADFGGVVVSEGKVAFGGWDRTQEGDTKVSATFDAAGMLTLFE